jgi:hypothetical protein
VEREGPQTDPGSKGDAQSDNVIRLPVEWLGPLDELVPIGGAPPASDPPASDPPPASVTSDASATSNSGSSVSIPVAHTIPVPLAADDFWGEESSSVQTVFDGGRMTEAPSDPLPRPELAAAPWAAGFRGARARRWSGQRVPLRAGGLVVAAAAVVCALTVGAVNSGRPRTRPVIATAGTAAHRRAYAHVARHTAPVGRSRHAPEVAATAVRYTPPARRTTASATPASYQAPALAAGSTPPSGAESGGSSNSGGAAKTGPPPCYPGQLGC